MNDRCAEHLTTLLRLVEGGAEIPGDLKSHLATCAECARLLEAMNRVQTDLERDDVASPDEPVVAQTLQQSAATVSRSRRARILAQAIAAGVTVVAAVWMIFWASPSPTEGLVLIGIVFLIIVPLFIAVALFLLVRKRFHEPGQPIYKRLKPGRQVDGVCLGLSEATGIQVVVLRVIFFALIFADGIGLWLYLLFALLMPTHPDDRQYLLRFQLARRWRRMTSRE